MRNFNQYLLVIIIETRTENTEAKFIRLFESYLRK